MAPAAGGSSIVSRRSTFDPKGAEDGKAKAVITGICDAGLGRLSRYFNAGR